ncbi:MULTISPECIES: TldD/PmbA family protein [Dictyoglomus]|uniref:Peptidase U62 modulator of DNA gyrase n=1 Tax=Dictyoglomus turgidum (strain DSM 6724 / Z-1310) TaxID=515635 RepID=B8DZX4_DICTD|nr:MULTISPECIES: TldD/PmbA family protein [Dictyoglomus]ACK42057.1 peptidase U62 modulator of DNA gyrase [Dictyoglomus turgidum DSM 6724]HBU31382.1 TldD/PmbA family protein [Dictyoglomus sp.]
MISKSALEEILDISLSKGGDFSELFFEVNNSLYFYFDDNRLEEAVVGEDIGVGLRVIFGDRTFYGYTTDVSLLGLRKLAQNLAEAVFLRDQNIKVVLSDKKEYGIRPLKDKGSFEIKEVYDILRMMNEKARSYDSRIVQFTSVIRTVDQKVLIANTDGDWVEDRRVRTVVYGLSVGSYNGVIQTGYESIAGMVGWELFTEEVINKIPYEASRRAILLLEAKEAPAGVMPVVISSKAGGVLIHEAVGHGLEADLVDKEVSVYKDKIGEKVASELVTMVDAGVLEGMYGSSGVDDEGVKTNYNVLIDRGVLKGYMHSRITAKKFNVPPSGNGRRQNFRYPPIPRMTNTFILPGESKLEDMLQRLEKGIYVVKMGGGQVDTTSGDFVFAIEEGYFVLNGEIKYPIRGATLIGNGPKVLEKIEMVGNDIGFAPGTCGKDGQGVPVTDGMPTILISEITIGGTEKGE